MDRLSVDDPEERCSICERLQCTRYKYLLTEIASQYDGPVMKTLRSIGESLGVKPSTINEMIDRLLSTLKKPEDKEENEIL